MLVQPPKEKVSNTARWTINGFPATLETWTAEEWRKLSVKPIDAQQCANGVWVTFRMD